VSDYGLDDRAIGVRFPAGTFSQGNKRSEREAEVQLVPGLRMSEIVPPLSQDILASERGNL
jgi:hypothetical protein